MASRSHGGTTGGKWTREYTVWQAMRKRCLSPTEPSYRYYGGRGITICERWDNFENFLADMGPRPEGTSIDRINNDLGYYPANCRWATRRTQMLNTRVRSDSMSGHRGVSWSKSNRKWAARIKSDGKYIHLGYFSNPDDASVAYRAALERELGSLQKSYGNQCDEPQPPVARTTSQRCKERDRCPWIYHTRCRTFRCSRCKRWVPWCKGASDDRPGRCDDCRHLDQPPAQPTTETKGPTP